MITLGNAHDVGDLIELEVAFTDENGAPADPTTYALAVQYPDGTEENLTGSVSNPAVGSYVGYMLAAQPGRHWYKWTGTGVATAVEAGTFYIRTPVVTL